MIKALAALALAGLILLYFPRPPVDLLGWVFAARFWATIVHHLTPLGSPRYDIEAIHDAANSSVLERARELARNGRAFPLTALEVIDATKSGWEDAFEEVFHNKGLPVIVRGVSNGTSKRYRTPTLESVARAYGKTPVPLFFGEDQVYDMAFDKYLEKLKDPSFRSYAKCIKLQGEIENVMDPENVASEQKLEYFLEQHRDPRCMFIGNKGSMSSTHCDGLSTTVMQVMGRKKWIFIPPEYTMYVYPFVQHPMNFVLSSMLDIFQPDYTRYPLFALAKGYEATLEPGDILYFKSMWWHSVRNLDELTISVILPIMDVVGSFSRNMPLLLGFLLNVNVWVAQLGHGAYDEIYGTYKSRCRGNEACAREALASTHVVSSD